MLVKRNFKDIFSNRFYYFNLKKLNYLYYHVIGLILYNLIYYSIYRSYLNLIT